MFEKWIDQYERKRKKGNDAEEEIQFKSYEEAEAPEAAPAPAPAAAAPASIEGNNIELKVMRPATFDDVSTIADHLIEGCTVVLNLELLDRATTVRMLDFLNGVTYTKDGEIKNVAQNTYIITPSGIDVHE